MKSIASAPGKIILFGEHFVVHGTKAILAAIDKRVTVTSTITKKPTLKINSQLGTFEVPMWEGTGKLLSETETYASIFSMSYQTRKSDFRADKIKSEFRPFVYLLAKLTDITQSNYTPHYALEHASSPEVGMSPGLEITIDSDIPIGVGLGSSSACCVAVAASLYALFHECLGEQLEYLTRNENIDPHDMTFRLGKNKTEDILSLAKVAERTIFPDTSGADCSVCTYGGMIEYTKNMERYGKPYQTKEIDNTFDLNLLIANSMIPHSTKNSVEKVSKFKENDEERFSQLCDLENGLIDEVIIAMKNNDAAAFGLKMSENQKYLEEIQVSNDTLRDMISSLNEISLGSKITGAGDGGCVIALVKDENMDKVPVLLPKDKEYFSAKIDTKGVVWKIEK